MKKLLFVLCLILLTCLRCTPRIYYVKGEEYHKGATILVWSDYAFDAQDQIAIMQGIEQWNIALNSVGHLEITNRDDAVWYIYNIDNKDQRYIARQAMEKPDKNGKIKTILAWAEPEHGDIFIVRNLIKVGALKGIVTHEIGHLFGLNHGGKLMAEYYDFDKYSCVDLWSIQQLSKKIKVDVKYFTYCDH